AGGTQPGGPTGAGPGGVAALGIVQPTLMAADVHGWARGRHAVEGVAAGEVDPGGLDRGADVAGVEPGGGITQPGGAVLSPGGDDHEVGTIGREIDALGVFQPAATGGAVHVEAGRAPSAEGRGRAEVEH